MTSERKGELIQHFKWLVANAGEQVISFTSEERDKNIEIWNILLDLKIKEKKND